MAAIKSKGTRCEKALAGLLRKEKLRFRQQAENLPGKPDFNLIEHACVVFVDGDFWHGREFAKWRAKLAPYWREKLQANRQRDKKVSKKLRDMGFAVVRIWESDLSRSPGRAIRKISNAIKTVSPRRREALKLRAAAGKR
jgi:DNA mismatch endonuclease (patch repair protein)